MDNNNSKRVFNAIVAILHATPTDELVYMWNRAVQADEEEKGVYAMENFNSVMIDFGFTHEDMIRMDRLGVPIAEAEYFTVDPYFYDITFLVSEGKDGARRRIDVCELAKRMIQDGDGYTDSLIQMILDNIEYE